MTDDEYRTALEGLTAEQFDAFRQVWGGAKNSIPECLVEFASTKDRDQWERIIVYRLRNLGVEKLQTESEKAMQFAKQTANAAEQSAAAANKSAASAARSNRAAWWSQVIALLAIIVTLTIARC